MIRYLYLPGVCSVQDTSEQQLCVVHSCKKIIKIKRALGIVVSRAARGKFGHLSDRFRCNMNILFSIRRIRSTFVPVGCVGVQHVCCWEACAMGHAPWGTVVFCRYDTVFFGLF